MLRPTARVSPATVRVAGAAHARRRWTVRRLLHLHLEAPLRRSLPPPLGQAPQHASGLGEAAPLPGYSPDTLDEVATALGRWCAAPPVLDVDDPIGSALHAASTLPRGVPSARFAVETAVLDLLGRLRGEPLHRLLGAADDPPALPCAGLVASLDDAEERAAALVARGLGTLKVKIGRAGRLDDEVAVLERLRARWPSVTLRLDANGGLPPARVDELLARYAAVAPELVEEPVSGAALRGLRDPPVPLALDESLQERGPARAGSGGLAPFESWLADGRCVAVVLKPAALGGLLACLDLARAAARHRVDGRPIGAIASHTFDGPVGLQASAALALALEHPRAAGLDRAYLSAAADAVPLVGPSALRPERALPGLGLHPVARADGEEMP